MKITEVELLKEIKNNPNHLIVLGILKSIISKLNIE